MITLTITGDRQIDKALSQLEPALIKLVVKKGMRAGMKILQAELKQTAPVGETGQLTNPKVRALPRRKNIIGMQVGYDKDANAVEGEPFHAVFVELGTSHNAPKGFMRQAFDEKKAMVVYVTTDEISRIAQETINNEFRK